MRSPGSQLSDGCRALGRTYVVGEYDYAAEHDGAERRTCKIEQVDSSHAVLCAVRWKWFTASRRFYVATGKIKLIDDAIASKLNEMS